MITVRELTMVESTVLPPSPTPLTVPVESTITRLVNPSAGSTAGPNEPLIEPDQATASPPR